MLLINLRRFILCVLRNTTLQSERVRVLNWFVKNLMTTCIHYTHLDDESKV